MFLESIQMEYRLSPLLHPVPDLVNQGNQPSTRQTPSVGNLQFCDQSPRGETPSLTLQSYPPQFDLICLNDRLVNPRSVMFRYRLPKVQPSQLRRVHTPPVCPGPSPSLAVPSNLSLQEEKYRSKQHIVPPDDRRQSSHPLEDHHH